MLDQVTAVLICKVKANESGCAFCEVVDLEEEGYDRERSIDTEFWLGQEMQLHQEMGKQTEKQFERKYPVGRRVRVAINIQPLPGKPKKAAE